MKKLIFSLIFLLALTSDVTIRCNRIKLRPFGFNTLKSYVQLKNTNEEEINRQLDIHRKKEIQSEREKLTQKIFSQYLEPRGGSTSILRDFFSRF